MGGGNLQRPLEPRLRRSAPRGGDPSPGGGPKAFSSPEDDLQSLLSRALEHLATATGSTRCVAWALGDDGRPYTAAATIPDGKAPPVPDAAALKALWQSQGATDLAAKDLGPGLAELARSQTFSAGAPLRSTGGDCSAVVLLGGNPDDPPGRVRPRTLAALDHTVGKLRGPISAVMAAARLAKLGREVAHLNRRASLGDLLGEIVHELRNPLVSMKTLIQLLPDRRNDPEFYQDFRQLVSDELARMERLLETLLHHGKPPSAAAEFSGPCRVRPVLDSMARLLQHRARSRGARLTLHGDPELRDVAISEDALRQILLNLALNALEATPEGGTVTVGASQREDENGPWVEVRIDDSGPGIPEEDRARLFEPFVSSRDGRPGGLGLAISQRLAMDVGGSIAVEDAPEGGARFRLQLPCAAEIGTDDD